VVGDKQIKFVAFISITAQQAILLFHLTDEQFVLSERSARSPQGQWWRLAGIWTTHDWAAAGRRAAQPDPTQPASL